MSSTWKKFCRCGFDMYNTNQKTIWKLIGNEAIFNPLLTANILFKNSHNTSSLIINKAKHESVWCGSENKMFHILWAVKLCYLWRPWRAAAGWWGRAPAQPWGGSECWSRSAPSETSSRGQISDRDQQCSQPWWRKQPQIPSLLPGLEDTKQQTCTQEVTLTNIDWRGDDSLLWMPPHSSYLPPTETTQVKSGVHALTVANFGLNLKMCSMMWTLKNDTLPRRDRGFFFLVMTGTGVLIVCVANSNLYWHSSVAVWLALLPPSLLSPFFDHENIDIYSYFATAPLAFPANTTMTDWG